MFDPIDGPAAVPGRRGLLDAATTPPEIAGARWEAGIAFQADSCDAADPFLLDYCAAGPGDLTELPRPGSEVYRPIGVSGYDACSTMDGRGMAEHRRRARSNLLATASYQAEREFFDGAASGADADPNPYLTDGTAVTVTSAALGPVDAMATLEQAMAECMHGQRGTIHATPYMVTLWTAADLLTPEGSLLVSPNGHVVVGGAGYSGDDPDGVAATAGTTWVYATPAVYAVRGTIVEPGEDAQRIDTATNHVHYYVYQPVLVWTAGCCHLAAQVDIDTAA